MLILSTEHPDAALRRYIEGVTGQTGDRLTTVMRVNGLVDPPLRGVDAADLLGVSPQRISQLADRMRVLIAWSTPPGGLWMPQTIAVRRLERTAAS